MEAWKLRFSLDEEPPESNETTKAALRYLNLCSEELYLKKQGYFSEEIFGIWESLFRRSLRSKLFQREWKKLKQEFESDIEFFKFVESIQNAPKTDG
jgi:hypothetical protein